MGCLIKAEKLQKYYRSGRHKTAAIHPLDFEVARGSLFAIRGNNGSGKSTLVRLVAGLAEPTAGTLLINTLPPLQSRRRLRTTVVLEGDRSFYWRLRVKQNLRFFSALYNLSFKEFKTRLARLATQWSFTHLLNQRVEALSAGNKRKLALMRALLVQPELLLLDDPCSGLDADSVAQLSQLLVELKQGGTTILFTVADSTTMAEIEDARLDLSQTKRTDR